jgi:hypothetical protein
LCGLVWFSVAANSWIEELGKHAWILLKGI